ncbi:hypothetical protein BASA83_011270 [Batrachochytrium salamandrivorans]|nr:hypothetical protein BASA83_011270 [Batrachochytrium salamandrivorans]
MWIDTAGTLPTKKSANRAASARLSCLVPIDSCSTVPSNQRWSRSASPFKTPPRSQSRLNAMASDLFHTPPRDELKALRVGVPVSENENRMIVVKWHNSVEGLPNTSKSLFATVVGGERIEKIER